MTKAQTHQTIIGINDEWETPPLLLKNKIAELGLNPIFDVCCNNTNTKFSKYYTIDNEPLSQKWDEDFRNDYTI